MKGSAVHYTLVASVAVTIILLVTMVFVLPKYAHVHVHILGKSRLAMSRSKSLANGASPSAIRALEHAALSEGSHTTIDHAVTSSESEYVNCYNNNQPGVCLGIYGRILIPVLFRTSPYRSRRVHFMLRSYMMATKSFLRATFNTRSSYILHCEVSSYKDVKSSRVAYFSAKGLVSRL